MYKAKEILSFNEKARANARMEMDFLDPEITFIPFKRMAEVEAGALNQIGQGVQSVLVEKTPDKLVFYVIAEPTEEHPNPTLAIHYHDCWEYFKSIYGEMVDKVSEGVIDPFEKHRFVWKGEGRMVVIFYLNQDNDPR